MYQIAQEQGPQMHTIALTAHKSSVPLHSWQATGAIQTYTEKRKTYLYVAQSSKISPGAFTVKYWIT